MINAQLDVQSTFGPKHAVVDDQRFLRRVAASARSSSRKRWRSSRPTIRRAMPRAAAADSTTTVNGVLRFDGAISRPTIARDAALTALEPRASAGDLKAAGFIIADIGASALGNSKGLFAYQPLDERELHAHGAHRRRHRLRLGGRRASGLEAARLQGGQRSARSRRRGCRAIRWRSSRALHGDPRAAGGRRSRAAARRSRSTRARPTKDAARSRSRAAATRSARRSSTSA